MMINYSFTNFLKLALKFAILILLVLIIQNIINETLFVEPSEEPSEETSIKPYEETYIKPSEELFEDPFKKPSEETFQETNKDINFYVAVCSIKGYDDAVNLLISSLPEQWKNKYIIIYQKEENEGYYKYDDGHIEVKIKQNLYEYGNLVGIHMLMVNDIIPKDTWILSVHDTCKFLNNTYERTNNIIKTFNNTDKDIIWLCKTGQCNICLIRKEAITQGYNKYKDIMVLDKMDGIHYEWNHEHELSMKSIKVNHEYIDSDALVIDERIIYNNNNKRSVLFYDSIDMEKYYVPIANKDEHPSQP